MIAIYAKVLAADIQGEGRPRLRETLMRDGVSPSDLSVILKEGRAMVSLIREHEKEGLAQEESFQRAVNAAKEKRETARFWLAADMALKLLDIYAAIRDGRVDFSEVVRGLIALPRKYLYVDL